MNKPVIGVGTLNLSRNAKKYVNEALDDNRLSYGPFLKKFESLFADIHEIKHAVMTSSGTDALRIALHVLKEKYNFQDGDEVIVPAVTFISTPNIVVQNRLTPVFVDVDPIHYELNPALIEEKITERTKAIIPVHLFGQPCDMDPIRTIAKKFNLKILEDSCETMFAKYKGNSVGTLGDVACFSTYVAHLIVTGIGGLILSNNEDVVLQARSLLNHGRDPIYLNIDDDKTKSFEELNKIVNRRFLFSQVGYSSRITELEGAIGLAQLEDYEDMLIKRKRVAQMMNEALSDLGEYIQLPTVRSGNDHSFMMYPICSHKEPKDGLVNFLEQAGIETRDMLSLTHQPIYKQHFNLDENEFPVAQWIHSNGFYIGCHQDISEDDIAYIRDNFRTYFLKKSKETKKESAQIILKNNIKNYDNLTKIRNIPFALFSEVVILGEPIAENIRGYIAKEFPHIKVTENVAIKELSEFFSRDSHIENVVFFDLTNMHNPLDIKRILFKLESGLDIVIASRFMMGGGKLERGWVIYRGFGNRIFTGLLNLTFNSNYSDSMTSLRGVKRKFLKAFTLKNCNWYNYHFNMSISAIKNELRVEEFPSKEILYEDTRPVHNEFISAFCLLMSLIKRVIR